MNIKEIIKEERKKRNITQEQLAEKIFVSPKTISNWEHGKTTPDIDSVIRLAGLFSLSLDNLLLEGSYIVENIKKQAELKSTRVYLICSFITNLAFFFILVTQPIYGELSLPALFALILAVFTNVVVLLYFSYKYVSLFGYDKYSDIPKKERAKAIVAAASIVLVCALIVLYISFYKV